MASLLEIQSYLAMISLRLRDFSKGFFVKRFQFHRDNWRIRQLRKLQDKRDRMLRQYKHYNILSLLFPSIETQIDNLKDEIAEIESLKAGRV
jgi:hypothetical protein